MTGSVWASAFVAAVFALHPLRVESVAWLAERKDVLSSFFWMLTILTYVRYAERPSIARYLVVFLLFGVGLMAKPMLVTLPFVLLLLDYWPLGRLQWGQPGGEKISFQSKSVGRYGGGMNIQRLIAEKSPLLVLSAVSSVVTYIVQQSCQAITDVVSLPLSLRIINALFSYISYLVKTVYPTGLALLYPHPFGSIPLWQPIVCFVVLSVISVVVTYKARRKRYLLVGWLWYLGTLVPVIGLVQAGAQGMADRYTYLPSIGIYIMITWGAAELFAKWHWRNAVLGITAGVVLFGLLLCTRVQVRYWQSNFTVFNRSLTVTENNYIAHNNYGSLLSQEGRLDEAIVHFRESVRINPKHAKAEYNLGLALVQMRKYEEAAGHLRKSLELDPNCPYTLINLAYVLATSENPKLRNGSEALQLAKKACELTDYSNPKMLKILSAAQRAAAQEKP